MKKTLLASTAIVGASMLAAPAYAGTAAAGDNYTVTISGVYWHQINSLDEDISAGHGRGYKFNTPEAEVYVDAKATADNGITYGVSLELNAGTDDTTGADEAYAQISSSSWGTVQLGDNDGAANQMKIGSFQANKSGVGTLGGLTALSSAFHNQFPGFLVRADWDAAILAGGDASKVTYFSPRFAGFQVGASLMPDSGVNGLSATERDDDGDFENTVDVGVNYSGKFDDFGVFVGAAYTFGDAEGNTSGTGTASLEREELEVFTIGASVNFAGFVVGADYRDNGESGIAKTAAAAGADAGTWWSVGVGYGMGPWGVDAHYALGEQDNASTAASGETEVTRYGLGVSYAVAPGWRVTGDYELIDHENISGGTTDNTAQAFMLTNFFSF
jgi:hypothetical protein